jgi:hypothetical protein
MSKSILARLRSKPRGRRFSDRLGVPTKVDNAGAALPAKVQIRQHVLAAIGADNARVFDAFAGEGQLYRRVWHQAAGYVGCDRNWLRDERLMYAADSRRVMRALPLQEFSIFDFDAYGSPWEHVVILCARCRLQPGQRFGLILTEGSGLNLKFGAMPSALAQLAGLRAMPGLNRERAYGALLDRALAAAAGRLGGRIVKRWQATGKTGAQVHYIGLVLEGA